MKENTRLVQLINKKKERKVAVVQEPFDFA